MIKAMLGIVSLCGMVFASGETPQEYIRCTFNSECVYNEGMTDEMQEIMDYRLSLYENYDFDNMSDDEVSTAMEEIHTAVIAFATELGIELPDSPYMSGFGYNNEETNRYGGSGCGMGRGSRGGYQQRQCQSPYQNRSNNL